MIFKHVENIFNLYPEAIAHPVNCIGLCHDSLSKKIKRTWPDYYREYARACLRKNLVPFKAFHHSINTLFGTSHIITITIRKNWQERLRQETVRESIESLIEQCNQHGIATIAIPNIEGVPQSWLESEIEKASKNHLLNITNTVYIFQND